MFSYITQFIFQVIFCGILSGGFVFAADHSCASALNENYSEKHSELSLFLNKPELGQSTNSSLTRQKSLPRTLDAEVSNARLLQKGISPLMARRTANRIRDIIAISSKFLLAGKLSQAAEVLNDASLLTDCGYELELNGFRTKLERYSVSATTEREYTDRMLNLAGGHVSPDGTVSLPIKPIEQELLSPLASFRIKYWVRLAAEELGHVAQQLFQFANGNFLLSHALSSEKRLLSEVETMHTNLNFSRYGKLRIDFVAEADIYAFLIETYGPEFIPAWVGTISGYDTRHLVDLHFQARGLYYREWDQPALPSY